MESCVDSPIAAAYPISPSNDVPLSFAISAHFEIASAKLPADMAASLLTPVSLSAIFMESPADS